MHWLKFNLSLLLKDKSVLARIKVVSFLICRCRRDEA